MALLTAVAGAYTGVWTPNGGSPANVGILADNGYTLSWSIHQQQFGNDGTDIYGLTLLGGIYRGADWSMDFRCREYSLTAMNLAWPYGKVATGSNANLSPILTGIGKEVTASHAGGLVLTAVSGTPAASNPATFTAGSAAARPGSNSSFDFTSKVREVPVSLNLFPYSATISSTSYNLPFVTT